MNVDCHPLFIEDVDQQAGEQADGSVAQRCARHLSARRRVLSFPIIQDAAWIAADETSPGYADRLAPLPTAVQLSWLRRNPEWRLVFERDGILIFHRSG